MAKRIKKSSNTDYRTRNRERMREQSKDCNPRMLTRGKITVTADTGEWTRAAEWAEQGRKKPPFVMALVRAVREKIDAAGLGPFDVLTAVEAGHRAMGKPAVTLGWGFAPYRNDVWLQVDGMKSAVPEIVAVLALLDADAADAAVLSAYNAACNRGDRRAKEAKIEAADSVRNLLANGLPDGWYVVDRDSATVQYGQETTPEAVKERRAAQIDAEELDSMLSDIV